MILNYHSDEGFTLLEVVTGLAILSLVLAALLPILASGPQRVGQAANASYAMQLASSNLELELLKQDWNGLPVSGADDDWAWSVSSEPYGDPIDGEIGYPIKIISRVWDPSRPEDYTASFERIVWVKLP